MELTDAILSGIHNDMPRRFGRQDFEMTIVRNINAGNDRAAGAMIAAARAALALPLLPLLALLPYPGVGPAGLRPDQVGEAA